MSSKPLVGNSPETIEDYYLQAKTLADLPIASDKEGMIRQIVKLQRVIHDLSDTSLTIIAALRSEGVDL